jgi:hypothetical protein
MVFKEHGHASFKVPECIGKTAGKTRGDSALRSQCCEKIFPERRRMRMTRAAPETGTGTQKKNGTHRDITLCFCGERAGIIPAQNPAQKFIFRFFESLSRFSVRPPAQCAKRKTRATSHQNHIDFARKNNAKKYFCTTRFHDDSMSPFFALFLHSGNRNFVTY